MAGADAHPRVRRAFQILLVLTLTLGGVPSQAARIQPLEYAVKATYLHKFVPFVEWPASAFASATSPVEVCVVGDAPFGDLLDRSAATQRMGERAFAVRRMPLVAGSHRCHVMYVAGSAVQSVPESLAAVRGTPVLTVTDGAADADSKGIVNFVLYDGRVRFEMDERAAAENGIAISSKLLSLAVSVRRRG